MPQHKPHPNIKPRLQHARHTGRRHRATPSTHRTVPTQAWKVATDLSHHRSVTEPASSTTSQDVREACWCAGTARQEHDLQLRGWESQPDTDYVYDSGAALLWFRTSDCSGNGSACREVDSRSFHFHVTNFGEVVHTRICLCHRPLATGRWCCPAVTAGLQKSNGSTSGRGWLKSHTGWLSTVWGRKLHRFIFAIALSEFHLLR